ncbi:MAG: cobalt ECF transporter T component CbiQ [Ruminiclostridium sp.]|nr:cobalt ECF transporter T component CbiQ [Ruminiclostridium sp.]
MNNPNIINSIYNMRLLDEAALKNTAIHRIHPLVKLVATVVYLIVVVSFDKYEAGRLLPFLFYPVIIFAFAELPVIPILKRILMVEPLIIGIGILNPLFDRQIVIFAGMEVSGGLITFLSIFIKCSLTVTAALLLIATTGMDKLASALRMLKVPRLFVLQLLLTYRYVSVLMEEVGRSLKAYSLKAPEHKGVQRSIWGPLAGQLILRTFDRAQRIYQAMCLRGFTGEYNTGGNKRIGIRDLGYLAGWALFFIILKLYDVPVIVGSLLTSVK